LTASVKTPTTQNYLAWAKKQPASGSPTVQHSLSSKQTANKQLSNL